MCSSRHFTSRGPSLLGSGLGERFLTFATMAKEPRPTSEPLALEPGVNDSYTAHNRECAASQMAHRTSRSGDGGALTGGDEWLSKR